MDNIFGNIFARIFARPVPPPTLIARIGHWIVNNRAELLEHAIRFGRGLREAENRAEEERRQLEEERRRNDQEATRQLLMLLQQNPAVGQHPPAPAQPQPPQPEPVVQNNARQAPPAAYQARGEEERASTARAEVHNNRQAPAVDQHQPAPSQQGNRFFPSGNDNQAPPAANQAYSDEERIAILRQLNLLRQLNPQQIQEIERAVLNAAAHAEEREANVMRPN